MFIFEYDEAINRIEEQDTVQKLYEMFNYDSIVRLNYETEC